MAKTYLITTYGDKVKDAQVMGIFSSLSIAHHTARNIAEDRKTLCVIDSYMMDDWGRGRVFVGRVEWDSRTRELKEWFHNAR